MACPTSRPSFSLATTLVAAPARRATKDLARGSRCVSRRFIARQYAFKVQGRVRLDYYSQFSVKLLLIEDDVKIAASVKRGLEGEGFTVDVVFDGVDGLHQAREGTYDALIVDLMLPGMSGFKICGTLREEGDWTPILVLTAKEGEYDQTEALDTGADDYLTKPFSFPVLVSRLRALLRRSANGGSAPATLAAGDLRIEPAARRAFRGDTEVELTARQFDVLEFLVRRAGEVQSKSQILDGVWEYDFDGDPNIVEVYIRRLRKAIDEPFDRRAIETVRGAGYRLATDGG